MQRSLARAATTARRGGLRWSIIFDDMPPRVTVVACVLVLCISSAALAGAPAPAPAPAPLPAQTSRYNRGDFPGRYRDENGKIKLFTLKHRDAPLYDGGGREIGRITKPVMLNVGAAKQMDLDGRPGKESYAWAWATEAGSGWIARDALVDAPPPDASDDRNPKPPREANTALAIDAAGGREKLANLRHVNSKGELPTSGGGNRGEHYAGRKPGERDFVYLLFAVPNVRRGGVAKDSLPNGSKFIPALDDDGKPIVEVMTMYRNDDLNQPVEVAFLYGRAAGGEMWGWLARANVGER